LLARVLRLHPFLPAAIFFAAARDVVHTLSFVGIQRLRRRALLFGVLLICARWTAVLFLTLPGTGRVFRAGFGRLGLLSAGLFLLVAAARFVTRVRLVFLLVAGLDRLDLWTVASFVSVRPVFGLGLVRRAAQLWPS
jgi:hypothetical protein